MFPALPTVQVYLAAGVSDMRKSINGLSILVAEHLELDPLSDHLFAFCNRKRDIVKVLYWDRNGFCLWVKRLEKGRFPWPEGALRAQELKPEELTMILDGIDFRKKFESLSFSRL